MKMLVFTTGLDHPLRSRVQYLVPFLLNKQINMRALKVLDFSFYEGNGSLVVYLKSVITFASEVSRSNRTVIRFPSLPVVTNSKTHLTSLMHFLHLWLTILLSKMIIISIDYDTVVCTDPFAGFVATSVAKPSAFFVYENIDDFAALQSGKIQRALTSFLEKYCLRRAGLIISVSKPLFRRAHLLNPHACNILIPNGVDLSYFSKPHENRRDPCLVFVGSLLECTGLELAIEAFPLLRKKIPGIKMKIAGVGEEQPMLENLVRTLALQDSILFLGKLSYDKVATLLLSSSVGIAMFKPCKASAFASPLKLFDYMAAGVPIVATDIGDTGRIVKESGAGVAVNWNVHEFVIAVENLLTNRDLWLKHHENGLQYVKAYDWNRLFEEWLQEIQNRSPNK